VSDVLQQTSMLTNTKHFTTKKSALSWHTCPNNQVLGKNVSNWSYVSLHDIQPSYRVGPAMTRVLIDNGIWCGLRINRNRSPINLMFMDPWIIVQFIKKNPTRCNNVSKFLLFHFYLLVGGHYPPTTQPSTYEKPEAASAVLGTWWWVLCRPKHVGLHINIE
jgi:hypothetical protein